MSGPIDSHCHLNSLNPSERESALDSARERGVSGFLVPAIRLDQAEDILSFCHRHEDVWCALGVHPHEAATWREGDERRLAALLEDAKAVAVGECGLDFYYDHAPRDVQENAMRQQWRLAMELDLPVVVHNRDSNEAMLSVAAEPEFQRLRADFHSFAGGPAMAEALAPRGFVFGMSGMITFKQADNVRSVLPIVPRHQVLVETDTPYLAPVPYRGKPNRPAYVVEILKRLALEWQVTEDEAVATTNQNFFRLFGKAAAP